MYNEMPSFTDRQSPIQTVWCPEVGRFMCNYKYDIWKPFAIRFVLFISYSCWLPKAQTAGGSRACVTVSCGQWFLGLLPSTYIETRIRWAGCFVSCHSNGYICKAWFLSFPDHVTKDIMMLAWCQHLSPECFKRDKKYANACEPRSTSLHTCPTNFSSLYMSLVMKLSEDRWRYLSHTHTLFFWFVRLLALRPLLAYCASLG
jgi:hypothetical protein